MKQAGLLVFLALAASAADREVTYAAARSGNDPPPAFDKGWLLYAKTPCRVVAYAPSGELAFDRAIELPVSRACSVAGLAADDDGSIAVTVAYSALQGYAGGIALLDSKGDFKRFIDTGRYLPSPVCFDGDHNLWTFGRQRDTLRGDLPGESGYGTVRRFSPDGKETGAFLPRSLWTGVAEPDEPQAGMWRIAAANDRIGALVFSEWIEWNLRGELISRTPIQEKSSGGTAFTASGHLYTMRAVPDHGWQLAALDTASGEWKPVAADLAGRGFLIGAQGDELVYTAGEGEAIQLVWAASAP